MNKINPVIIDWQITSKCTRQCEFCYGPQHQEMSTSDIFKMIDNFEELGVRVVGITGGEPLTMPKIDEIFRYIKEKGMAICLSSNADLYKKYRDIILTSLDTIGIPVEGSSQDIHDGLRGKGSFEAINFALDDISKNSDIKFRIGTVITDQNYKDLTNIEKMLSRYGDKVIYWKLYEYIVYRPDVQNTSLGIKNRDNMLYEVSQLGKYLGNDSIIFDTLEKRSKSYFLIKPNGDVFVPTLNKETMIMDENVIGNVLHEPLGVLEKWRCSIDPDGYNCPHRCIYRKDAELGKKYLE